MRRAIQSAKFYKSIVKKNSLLNEINYGKAEGLNIQQFSKKYPKIILSWKKRNDAKFPNGENLLDVEKRMKSFINYIDSKKNENRKILAVSHNVFCRCLIGFFYNVNKYNIYKIYIPYGTKLEFIKLNDKLVPNIKNKKLKIIFRNIHENSYSD
jgi:broad specificity phosphatase PhoE